MLEAMAAGLPTITTPVGAIPEVLRPGEHGFINEPTDVEGFFRDLSFMIDNPNERRQMGQNSYDLANRVSFGYHISTIRPLATVYIQKHG